MEWEGRAGASRRAWRHSGVLEDRRARRWARPGRPQRDDRRRVFARAYTVFNCAQVDGYVRAEKPKLSEDNRIERAERFCGNLGVDIQHGGGGAFYVSSQDFVQMPDFKQFVDPTSYYAVLLHEWMSRQGKRRFGMSRFYRRFSDKEDHSWNINAAKEERR